MARDRRYKALINCTHWRKLRNMVLAQRPLCEDCHEKGRITSASEVHHIIPVESGRTDAEMLRLAYTATNLVSLCHACHVERHRQMKKGTKEANEERMKQDVGAFVRRFFSAKDPGG